MTDSTVKFVIPVLTPFPPNLAPSFPTLNTLQTELNANAQGIRSSAGGLYGLLSLTMSPAKYATLPNVIAFIAPVDPGDTPVHLPGATQPVITEGNRAHLVQKAIYEKYQDTDTALKTLLLSVCPDLYLEALKQPQIGYGARTTLELLTHLWASYGKIEPSHLWENEKRMKTAWHPTEPIEKLFSQLKATFEVAIAGNAGITEVAVVRIGYQIIMDTGLFKQELKEWRGKPEVEHTLINFNIFFKAANIDRLATTADGGFHSANVSASFVSSPITHLSAAAPVSDYTALKLELAQLKKQFQAANKKSGGDTTPATGNTYCWTHGWSKNISHTSQTCKSKAAGHKDEATTDNTMGGSQKVWTAPISPRV